MSRRIKKIIIKTKQTISKIFVVVLCTILIESCMMTKTSIGAYKEAPGKEYTYDKGKQIWLFWGLIPIGRTDLTTPSNGECVVISKFRFTDFLVTGITGGIVTSFSIKVKAKKQK